LAHAIARFTVRSLASAIFANSATDTAPSPVFPLT
jgi:hypothetical protein